MADDKNDAPAGMLGDALTAGEQAYLDSGGQNTEGLITPDTGAAAAATDTAKTSAEDTGKPSPDGAAKPGADGKVDAKADAKPSVVTDAKPELKPEDDDTAADVHAVDPQKPPPQRVSYHKYRREESRRKEAEKALAELNEKFTRGDERLKLLTEALTPKADDKAQEDPEPDPQKDIFAWIEWSKRDRGRLQAEIRSARQDVGKTQETIQQRDDADGLRVSFHRDAIAFAQTNPDYKAAHEFMLNKRAQTLLSLGYGEQQVGEIVRNEERGIIQRMLDLKRSPAQAIYQMAQEFGYQRQAPDAGNGAAKPAAETTSGNGAATSAAAKPSVTEEIARIKAGQEAGKTLSGAGGAANELSVAGLLAMSEDDFAALLRKSPGKVNALMGAN